MGINKVDQKSIGYRILWYIVKFWHHIIYYQKIEIANEDKVPKIGAILFTPNHQNALMDALALLFSVKRTLVFLARADIFKKNTLAEILYFLRILPVFRPRDGQGEVKKNLQTFKKTSEVLQKNLGLVIFPEGTHTDKQSLLPLKKGFVKIALQTEESNDYHLGIKLMPMAISYTDYEQCRSTLSINFGDPIDLSPYYKSYKEHPAKAFNAIRDELSDALKKNMIHIEDDEYYHSTEYLMSTYQTLLLGKEKQNHRILDGHQFLEKLHHWRVKNPESFEILHQQTEEVLSLTHNFSKRQRVILAHWKALGWYLHSFVFLVCSPIILISILLNLPTYLLSNIPSFKIKDHQFHSTFRFVLSFLIMPLTYLFWQVIFHMLCPSQAWYYFLFIYLILLFTISYSLHWLRIYKAETRIFLFKLFNAKAYTKLSSLLSEIQKTMQSI